MICGSNKAQSYAQPEHFCLMSYSCMNDERLMGIQELKDKIAIDYMAKKTITMVSSTKEDNQNSIKMKKKLSHLFLVILP